MVIDWIELSKAVPYAAIAIVFGLFMLRVLELVGRQRAEDNKRQDEKDARLMTVAHEREQSRDTQYLDALRERELGWREFMTQQQIMRGEQWSAVVAELKQLTAIVTLSADLLRSHDSWERGLLSAMQAKRAGETYPSPKEGQNGPNT